ncbi:MAG: hypothetical protein KME54_19590 [Tolypothrix brevis GSE-NOS-MK-07-07A]|nr:hypothetical protein [Tolypothrix brevis GSE-NOS-MK-07-07A]
MNYQEKIQNSGVSIISYAPLGDEKGRSLALPAHSIEPRVKMLVAVRNSTQTATLLTSDF